MKKIILIGACFIASLIIGISIWFGLSLKSVSKTSEPVTFTIDAGLSAKAIVTKLKEANLVKSELVAKVYMFTQTDHQFQAGVYELNRNMDVKKIFKTLKNGGKSGNTFALTFVEGDTLTSYINMVAKALNKDSDELLKEVNSKEFLEPLITKYWFLDKSLLEKNVYYYLEGYLFPNTYEFYQDSSLSQIISKLLDETSKRLEPLKEEITSSGYSVHEILTMASIIEKEAGNPEYRETVSQVIQTRLKKKMNLGMDVTSYYGVQKSLKETLTTKDLNDDNPYNTRNSNLIGLPIGPICNPSIGSIKASLNPSDTNYVYFFADAKGVIHFTDNYQEFLTFKETYK